MVLNLSEMRCSLVEELTFSIQHMGNWYYMNSPSAFSEGAPRSKFKASPQQQLLRQEMRPPLSEPKNREPIFKIREGSIHQSKKRPVAEHAAAAAEH